jgi:hypothetical protein
MLGARPSSTSGGAALTANCAVSMTRSALWVTRSVASCPHFQAGLNAIFGSTTNSDASLELRRRQFQERNGQGSP